MELLLRGVWKEELNNVGSVSLIDLPRPFSAYYHLHYNSGEVDFSG